MHQNNHLLKFTMTYGLYLGLAFSLSVFIMHLMGRVHTPGDEIGYFNALLLSFGMLIFGRKYRDTYYPNNFLYRQALGFCVLLSLFAGFIYSIFGYWYYSIIEPTGIDFYIEQMKLVYLEYYKMTPEQAEAMITFNKNVLTPGSLAFFAFFSYSFVGVLLGLLASVFVKTPIRYEK